MRFRGLSRRRRVLLGVLAGLAVTLITGSTALAAGPVRTVTHPTAPFRDPAGTGCAFGIRVQPEHATVVDTTYSNGTSTEWVHSDPILTNVRTGKSLVWHARFLSVEKNVAATHSVVEVDFGQFTMELYPGDQGPYGVVAWPGLFLSIVGEVTLTVDADTGTVTHFSMHGIVTGNICAELAA
jgi:hypothetical protein